MKHAIGQDSFFPTVPNGFIKDDVTIKTDEQLQSSLTSLQDRLFAWDSKGFNTFYRVVMQQYRFGHVRISYISGKNITVELMCRCCCRYVGVTDVNPKWGTVTELQEARATLLSFISGCEYTLPGSDNLPQR